MNFTPKRRFASNHNEERLVNLLGYNITEKYEKDGTFQHVAGMASHIFNSPLAFISFVGEKTFLIKASVGVEGITEVKKELGLCSTAVLQEKVTVIENARAEPSLSTNPLVHGSLGLQFYAGAPLKTPKGINIGVLAIADIKPRAFSTDDEKMLEGLATIVMEELEERKQQNR